MVLVDGGLPFHQHAEAYRRQLEWVAVGEAAVPVSEAVVLDAEVLVVESEQRPHPWAWQAVTAALRAEVAPERLPTCNPASVAERPWIEASNSELSRTASLPR